MLSVGYWVLKMGVDVMMNVTPNSIMDYAEPIAGE